MASPQPSIWRFPRWGFPLVLLAAFLLRAWHLGARSLWTDEGSAWTSATSSLHVLLLRCIERDASPPLYYLFSSVALHFGDGEAALRSISMLASVALVWITYRMARLGAGRRESTVAAALCALSAFQVMYAQEARTYALVACFSTLALYLFVRAALLGRSRAWVPYVIVSALALYTQSLAVLGIGTQAALIVLTREGRLRWKSWAYAQLVAIAVYVPWWYVSRSMSDHLSSSHWYIGEPDARSAFKVLRAVLISPISLVTPPPGARLPGLEAFVPRWLASGVLLLAPLGPLLASLVSARGRGDRPLLVRAWIAAFAIPLLAVFVVSFWHPLFIPRYFVFLTPPLAVLMARGLFALRPGVLARVWAVVLLLCGAYAVFRYDTDYTKEPWRAVVRDMGARAAVGRTAALVPFDLDPFTFYNRHLEHPVAAFEVSRPEEPFAAHFTPPQIDAMERDAALATANYEEVWVVVRSPNSDVRREVAARAERAAARGRVLIERHRWESTGGPLRVARYARNGARPDSSTAAKSR